MKKSKNQKIKTAILLLMVFCFGGVCVTVQAQNFTKGQVVNSTDDAVPAVTITNIQKSIAVTTDESGNFTIQTEIGNSLEFSMIGYQTQRIQITNAEPLSIVLQQQTTGLDEVVVVGYGTRKKIHLTGSVATISGKDLTDIPVANISNSLGGRMPGLIVTNPNGRPGSGSTLNIRGFSTLGNNSPLIIVDGVQRDDGFNAFDPNEIESVTILKDAAATAVYGARANNGVFLVTTKRGKTGKPLISYNGSMGLQKPTQFPRVMSGFEYATAYNTGLINAGFDPDNPSQAGRFYNAEVLKRLETGEQGADWYDVTFKKNSMITNHNVTVNGGTDAVKYFASIGTVDQDGMYDNINYKAYRFRSNVDLRVNKTLNVGIDLEGRQENSNAAAIDANRIFEHVVRLNPTYSAYFPSGRPVNTGGEHSGEEIKNSGYNRLLQNTFQGTLSAVQQLSFITEGLSVNGRISFGKQYGVNKVFALPYTMYNEDANGNVTGTKVVGGQPSLSQAFTQYWSKFYNVSLNYIRGFGRHNVNAMILYEQNQNDGNRFNAFKQDFPTTAKDEFFISGPANQSVDGTSFINDARRAFVGRLGYVFDDKYLLETSFRYDGSYIFPKGKRFGFFPAVSAGWRVSEEQFFKNSSASSFITNLKLRASKGMVGNDKVSAFQFEDAYTISSTDGPFFNNTPQSLTYYGVYPNPNITWEKADNTNIGFEAGFLRNKLLLEFDYFIKDTRDILWSRSRSVPATFGRSLPNENYARVKNKGFELLITHQNTIGEVNYKLSANGSYAKNKVLVIDDPANALDFQKQLGRPMGIRVGYKSLGFFQSSDEINNWMGGKQFGRTPLLGEIKYADVNSDGQIDSNDQMILSDNTGTPRIMFGASGDVRWKGFDVSFLFQGAAARNFLLSTNGRIPFSGGIFKYMLDAWSPENPQAKYPSLIVGTSTNNNRNSEVWLTNGAYLRLKSINIGYTLPRISMNNFSLTGVRVFVSGFNVFTWSKIKDFDPEAESSAAAYYPQQKVFSAGLNINF